MLRTQFLKGTVMSCRKNPYLSDLCSCSLGDYKNELVSGDNSHTSFINAIVPALGEYIERKNMEYKGNFNNNIFKLFNMSTSKKEELSIEEIFKKEIFSDSCGLATHLLSYKSIENSLNEFLERQFFIFNYLSKTSGEYIEQEIINKYVEEDYKYFNFFNISIVEGYYVLLAYGSIGERFIIGLGSSVDFVQALKKCVKEINQFISMYIYENNYYNSKSKETLDYMDYFLMFSSKELHNAYSYLYDNKKIFKHDLIHKKNHEYNKVIKDIWEIYGIDTLLFFIKPEIEGLFFKETKIATTTWFPTLNPRLYKEEMYLFIENRTGKKLDRKCNFIPFP